MGSETNSGPDICELPHFHAEEFGKHHKQNKTTAKLVGNGIANSITDNAVDQINHLKAQALIIAKLANSM